MAYQAKHRDPLFDSTMQEAIERRGRELVGLVLIGLALAGAAMLISYAPDDPSWMSSIDAPAQNWLGRAGASVSAALMIVVGQGAWVAVIGAFAWGIRTILHRSTDHALGRAIFTPLALATASVYAATLTPSWSHSFGYGGLFGDTVLGALITLVPDWAPLVVRLLAVPLGLLALVALLFVCGVTRAEARRFWHYVTLGIILIYAGIVKLLGRGAGSAAGAARAAAQRRREAKLAVRPAGAVSDDLIDSDDTDDAPAPKIGLLSSVSTLVRRPVERTPEPEIVDPELPDYDGVEAPEEDRIKERINDAIRLRARGARRVLAPGASEGTAQGGLTGGRRHRREPLLVSKVPGAVPSAPMAEVEVPDLDAPGPLVAPAPIAAPRSAPQPAPEARADAVVEPDESDEFDPLEAAPASVPSPEAAPRQTTVVPRAAPPETRSVVQHPVRKPVQASTRARAEAQPSLSFEDKVDEYEVPPLSLLTNPDTIARHHLSEEALQENARMLENVLDDYGVKGEIVSVSPGPVVTMYELEPAPGLKASRVIGLADDIARSMSALSARVSTVPGRSVIGIELPNANREKVVLREILSARDYGDSSQSLPLALGKDIGGRSIVANLAKMPHLLIAGTTGSGKSVAINTMILSLLYRLSPEECRLIMIDPKMLELSVYDGIPHLLSPVVTDPKKAVVALKWVVAEMEDRYRKMSKMGVRNIEGYNSRVREALSKGELFSRTVQTGFDDETGEPVFQTEEFQPETIPFIVVVVDEMADLMMVAGKEIEACIQRLAQMARASGIHLIMATQRPSVDVITGTIKANFPTRISFQVTSKIDSRTILGEMGAEQLLGMGDMLYMAGGSRITRVHGPFVSDEEVEEIVNHLKSFGPPSYVGGVVEGPSDDKESDIDAVLGLSTGGNTDGEDALYDQAVAIVIKDRKCSTSYIQRKLAIGYNKAARLVEQMEDEGVVSASNHVGKREILVPEVQ
ncbi:DNA translocase FtsK [Tropicimonas sp. IMCC34011]|uniref:DNA translocase FtsK n=1 Tax=Tropicimonas sp. IMCC34011 TaxID=2248759 RepID=UPI000E26F5BB|nr:DNA translocase FtsK [Tropicimonas sp. IMCC34011]